MSDPQTTSAAQQVNIEVGGDGCCHKTRLKDAPCPLGWKCPYIKEAVNGK